MKKIWRAFLFLAARNKSLRLEFLSNEKIICKKLAIQNRRLRFNGAVIGGLATPVGIAPSPLKRMRRLLN